MPENVLRYSGGAAGCGWAGASAAAECEREDRDKVTCAHEGHMRFPMKLMSGLWALAESKAKEG